jgi:osmotically inducible protein OsmC
MATRTSEAVWEGKLKSGKGKVRLGSGLFEGSYSFQSRFEQGNGTNPEELIGAAHAGCFSMALAGILEKEGYEPERIHTTANVSIEKVGNDFSITKVDLKTEARVPDIDEETFREKAQEAKKNCPVSRALAGAKITLVSNILESSPR